MVDLNNKASVANFLKKYGYTLDATMFQVTKSMNTALNSGTEALDKFFDSKEFQKEINEQARTAIVLLALEACLSSKDKTVHALIDSILTEDGLSREGKIKQIDQDAYNKIFDLIHSHKDTAALEIYCTALSETGVKVVVDKLKEADLKGFTDSQLIDYAIAIGKLKESEVIDEKTAGGLVQKFMTAVTKVPSSLKDKQDFYKHVLPLIPVDPIMEHPLIEMTIKNGNRKGGWKLIEDIVKFSPGWKDNENTKTLLKQLIIERTEQKAFSATSLPGNTLGTVLGELKDTKLNVRVFNSMIGARERFEGKAWADLNEKATAGYDSAIYAIFTHKESAIELYNSAKGDDKKLKTLLDYHEVAFDKEEYSIGYLIYDSLSLAEQAEFLNNPLVDPLEILYECARNNKPTIAHKEAKYSLESAKDEFKLVTETKDDFTAFVSAICQSADLKDEIKHATANRFFAAVKEHAASLDENFYNHILPFVETNRVLEATNKKGVVAWEILEKINKANTNKQHDNLLKQIIEQQIKNHNFVAINYLANTLPTLKDTTLNIQVFDELNSIIKTNSSMNTEFKDVLAYILDDPETVKALHTRCKTPKNFSDLLANVSVDGAPISYKIYSQLGENDKVAFLTNEAVDPFQILKTLNIQVVTNPNVTAKRGDFWSDKSDTNLVKCASNIKKSNLSEAEKDALIQRITKHVDHNHAAFFTTPVVIMPDFIQDLKTINNPNLNTKVFKALIVRREEITKEAGKKKDGIVDTTKAATQFTSESTLLHILTNAATVEALYQDYKANSKGKLEKLLGNKPVNDKSVAYYMYKGLEDSKQRQEFLGNKLVNPESILSSMPQSTKADYVEFLKDYTAAITDVTQYTKPYSDPNEVNELSGPYKLTLNVDGEDIKVGSMLDLMLNVDDNDHALFNEFAKQFVTKIPTGASSVIFNAELEKVTLSLQDIKDPKLSHDLMTKLYSEILSTPRGVELAKGFVVTEDTLEIGTYLLTNCKVEDRADIIAKLSPQILKDVLENLRGNEYIDTKVKLEILAIALGIDKYKAVAIEVAATMQIPANFGDQAALKTFSLALIQYEPTQDVVKMLSEVDDKLAKSSIETIAKYDNKEVYAIIRGVANKAPKRVESLAGAEVTVDKKAQVLLGFADSGDDVYDKVSKFLDEANKTAKSIDLTNPASIKNAFYINTASTEDLNAIINLLTTYAVNEAKNLDQVTQFFDVGTEVFTSGASGPKDPAARDRFIVGYFDKLKKVNPDLATKLLGSAKMGEILTAASKVGKDNLMELVDIIFTTQGNRSDAQFITAISAALSGNIREDDRLAFIDAVSDKVLERAWGDDGLDQQKYSQDNLGWMIKERSLDKNKEFISIMALSDEESGKQIIMEALVSALDGDTRKTATTLISSMLETKETRLMLTNGMSDIIKAMTDDEIRDLNFNITLHDMPVDEKTAMRKLLFGVLISENKLDALTLIADKPQNMKISEIGINGAVAILNASKTPRYSKAVLNALLSENKAEDLKALLVACKDSPELISLIADIRAEAKDPNIYTALATKTNVDEKNTTTYNDIYVLNHVVGLKEKGLDAVTAAGLLLEYHNAAKDNPILQKAIEEYYDKYVSQAKQALFSGIGTGQQSDLDNAIKSIKDVDPKLLAKFFNLPSVVVENPVQQPVATIELKPVNLLLFDFKFLVQLNEAHEKHKAPEQQPEAKDLIDKLIGFLKELFTRAVSDKDVKVFAENFEKVMTEKLDFKKEAAVEDRHPDNVKALVINPKMDAEKAPEFAKEAFKKAAIVRKTLDPETLKEQGSGGQERY